MPNPTAPLDARGVRSRLAGTRFADVRYLPQTSSTNDDALKLLGESAARGATIVADYQTAGVGRKGRRWLAPAGSALLFTTILPQPTTASDVWAVPFWTALCVAEAVEAVSGIALDLVWPNDLFAHDRKMGGILSIARIAGEEAWIGCGVGLNIHRPAGDSELAALDPQPVFLDQLAADAQRENVLAAILSQFDRTIDALADPRSVAARWERRARLRGTPYRYRRDIDGIERDGIAERLGPHGALIVRDASVETAIDMADVRVIRRAPSN